jgi:hypothetical protein
MLLGDPSQNPFSTVSVILKADTREPTSTRPLSADFVAEIGDHDGEAADLVAVCSIGSLL